MHYQNLMKRVYVKATLMWRTQIKLLIL